jgi:hypothetical protein
MKKKRIVVSDQRKEDLEAVYEDVEPLEGFLGSLIEEYLDETDKRKREKIRKELLVRWEDCINAKRSDADDLEFSLDEFIYLTSGLPAGNG